MSESYLVKYAESRRRSYLKRKEERKYCAPCNKLHSSSNWARHLKSQKHIKNAENFEPKDELSEMNKGVLMFNQFLKKLYMPDILSFPEKEWNKMFELYIKLWAKENKYEEPSEEFIDKCRTAYLISENIFFTPETFKRRGE